MALGGAVFSAGSRPAADGGGVRTVSSRRCCRSVDESVRMSSVCCLCATTSDFHLAPSCVNRREFASAGQPFVFALLKSLVKPIQLSVSCVPSDDSLIDLIDLDLLPLKKGR